MKNIEKQLVNFYLIINMKCVKFNKNNKHLPILLIHLLTQIINHRHLVFKDKTAMSNLIQSS